MAEIIFIVEQEPDGGFTAKAPEYGIFTQGDDWQDLQMMVRDAVACTFDADDMPKSIRLHFVRDEVIAA